MDGDIYAMTLDGTDPVNMSARVGRDVEPGWSPDGLLVAFTSWRDGAPDIWVMNADGTAARNLTNDGVADTSPA